MQTCMHAYGSDLLFEPPILMSLKKPAVSGFSFFRHFSISFFDSMFFIPFIFLFTIGQLFKKKNTRPSVRPLSLFGLPPIFFSVPWLDNLVKRNPPPPRRSEGRWVFLGPNCLSPWRGSRAKDSRVDSSRRPKNFGGNSLRWPIFSGGDSSEVTSWVGGVLIKN